MINRTLIPYLLACSVITILFSIHAEAVPSFARQTGMACTACHTVFPELTEFGRSFKINGYTLTGIKQVAAKKSPNAGGLQFDQIPPLSAMLQTSATHAKSQQPSSDISLPDELSFFFAGEVSPHLGSFIQLTMEQGSGFSLDNTDIRYANQHGKVTYGVTLNNNPSVQDLWNSTPAWGYPFTHGADLGAPIVADALAQNVAGLGGYADWGNGFYTELSLYRDTDAFDAPSGVVDASDPTATQQVRVDGLAPYWRLAWHKNINNGDTLMIGTYGMRGSLYATDPAAYYKGPKDKYTDIAVDTQYEHSLGKSNNSITLHASYSHETQHLDLSMPGISPALNSLRVDGTYHWGYYAAASLAYAQNSGSSVGNSYDDNAWTAQVSYLPWQNTKFTLQYAAYTKLGGQSGSAASDNNTLLLQAWLMW